MFVPLLHKTSKNKRSLSSKKKHLNLTPPVSPKPLTGLASSILRLAWLSARIIGAKGVVMCDGARNATWVRPL